MVVEAKDVERGEDVTRTFLVFLNTFTSEVNGTVTSMPHTRYRDYVEQLESMYDRNGTTLYVDFHDLSE